MDYETCLKCYTLPFIQSDKLPYITLKYELDLIIYAQILEVIPQSRHNTVHIVTALIVHI